ncbi:hypothetical protein Tco_0884848 [Tanacetum coccineum]
MAPRRTTRAGPAPETTTTTTSVTNAQLQAMTDQGVTAALATRDANKNGDDSHASGMGVRGNEYAARECTYLDFLKSKPLNFKGIEGVVGLTQWFEKMESVFSISNCTVACQVKFETCTLQENVLTWWNSHVKTTTPEVAHAMPWKTLKKMITDKYCPRGEIKKIEFEMCDRMFPKESEKVEKYVSGLPDMIHDALLLKDKLRTRGNLITTTKLNNDFPRDKMWLKLTPLGLVKGRGYYKSDCPELKNGNQAGVVGTRGMVLALVGGEPNQDLDDMEDNTNA